MERLHCKKENKMVNSKANKDMKQTVKKMAPIPKGVNKVTKKDEKVTK